ncbi:MAG: sodium/proton-translocating pyrophosphatase [Chthonomonas sp.]|nr:sodium/proton-translocating pyrophosphatase [Chthonomonas sp.]
MMGGMGGAPIQAAKIVTQQQGQQELFDVIKEAQDRIASKKYDGDVKKVKGEDLKDEKFYKDLELGREDKKGVLTSFLGMDREKRPEAKALEGFARVNYKDTQNPVLGYAVPKPQESATPAPSTDYITLGEFLKAQYDEAGKPIADKQLKVWEIKVTQTTPATPPAQPTTQTQMGKFGPMDKATLDRLIKQATETNKNLKVEPSGKTWDVQIMANTKGDLAVGIVNFDMKDQVSPLGFDASYYKLSPDAVKKGTEESQKATDGSVAPPEVKRMDTVGAKVINADWWRFLACVLFGLLMAFAFEMLTDYYVSTHRKPVQEVGKMATAGPAPMIIQGMSYGMESSVFSVLAIVVSLMAPLFIFPPALFGGYILSFYGIALVGLGLLTTTGYILAMDTFGPISDNAQGVFEMSGAGHANPEASKGIQRLDAAGNTTKALTKGFAIATAVVAAVALFHSYVESAKLTEAGMRLEVPEIFLGLLIGGAAPYLFAAFSINAVGRAAFDLINEVRRQFREDKGIMAGTSKPDYSRCVAIVTAAAQKELMGPGILAIFLPVAVAFGFSIGAAPQYVGGVQVNLGGAQALGGFLAGTILSGQLLAVMLANSGGLWDNAKKLIEDGLHGGKGTEAHKAGVVCDTVGDPFKDTAGPALNPLIKVMNLVALLLAPVIIKPMDHAITISITVVAVLALAFSFMWSKRGSLSDGLKGTTDEA